MKTTLVRLARRWTCPLYRPYLARGIVAFVGFAFFWGGSMFIAGSDNPWFQLLTKILAMFGGLFLGGLWMMFWTWDHVSDIEAFHRHGSGGECFLEDERSGTEWSVAE